MEKKPAGLRRNEFIKLSLLGGSGWYLSACSGNQAKETKTDTVKDSLVTDSVITPKARPATAPTFNLYKKDDDQYEVLRKAFNKRISHFPQAIAECRNTEEVAQAVQYGIKNQLAVNIKSGGHSFEGFSGNDDGLVIDLSKMNTLTWENENSIVVQPACKLSELYDAILPKNKILPAGSCGGVGIGGLTLGGGYGLFSRKYGLTCDNVTEITMVDGKGNIINTRNDEELLWACKGGGNGNFGVITEFKFRLKNAPGNLQSFRFKSKITDVNVAVNILEKWFAVTEKLPLSCFSAFVLNGRSLYILLTNFEKNNAIAQSIIDELSVVTDRTSRGQPIKLSKAIKTFYGISTPIYFKNSSAGFYENFNDIKNCILEVLQKVMATSGMIYQVNTLGGKINDPGFAAVSSFAHRNKNYLSELQTYWDRPSQTDRMVHSFEEAQQIFYANGIRDQYRNYPDIHFKDYGDAYFGENYARLQNIKNKYDPENLFRYEQSIKNA